MFGFDKAKKMIKTIMFIASMVKLARSLIEEFEVPGNGEKKKKKVLEALEKAWKKAQATYDYPVWDWAIVEDYFSWLIDTIVELLNLTIWGSGESSQ